MLYFKIIKINYVNSLTFFILTQSAFICNFLFYFIGMAIGNKWIRLYNGSLEMTWFFRGRIAMRMYHVWNQIITHHHLKVEKYQEKSHML